MEPLMVKSLPLTSPEKFFTLTSLLSKTMSLCTLENKRLELRSFTCASFKVALPAVFSAFQLYAVSAAMRCGISCDVLKIARDVSVGRNLSCANIQGIPHEEALEVF